MAFTDPISEEVAERKLYGDAPGAGTIDQLPSAGDPAVGVDSQNNDEYFEYDTDARNEAF